MSTLRFSCSPLLTTLLTTSLLLAAPSALRADADVLQARTGGALAAGDVLALTQQVLVTEEVEDGEKRQRPAELQAQLSLPSGEARTLLLPASAQLSDLTAVDDGWLLAGTVESVDGRRDLMLLGASTRRADCAEIRLPSPDGQRAKVRWEPALLTDAEGGLRGIAWLEGDSPQGLAVRAAAFEGAPWVDGATWSEPEDVAAAGPGSQLALQGAVLTDGSWLLVWSGFDGRDDEILYAVRDPDGSWDGPRVLRLPGESDNQVPDITPTVIATPEGGALVAWSRFHAATASEPAGYRVHLVAFQRPASRAAATARRDAEEAPASQESWRLVSIEEPGTLFPQFVAEGVRPLLLLQHAWPRAWELQELESTGRQLRRTLGARGVAAVPQVFEPRPRGTEADAETDLVWLWSQQGQVRSERTTWDSP